MADEPFERVYTLKQAVEKFFPGGAITVAALRTEIRKGRLIPERIAGKFCVTESAIRRMRKLCRENPSPHSPTYTSARDASPSRLSEVERGKRAQAACEATLESLKASLRAKSRKSPRSTETAKPVKAQDVVREMMKTPTKKAQARRPKPKGNVIKLK